MAENSRAGSAYASAKKNVEQRRGENLERSKVSTVVNTNVNEFGIKPDTLPIAESCGIGLVASLCCGGSIVFAGIGLGALYSSLGLARFVPPALVLGAVL